MPSRLEIILKLTTIVYWAQKYSLNTTKAYGINIIEILKIEVNKKNGAVSITSSYVQAMTALRCA